MRDKVFISYSRKDKRWLDLLKTFLRQFVRDEKVSIWDDTKIAAGADWREEIKGALESAKVAVLLVSQDFLASDFIQSDELPPLLQAAQNDEAKILWIAVRPSTYRDTVIARYQALNSPSKTLYELKGPEREKAFVQICEAIKEAANPNQSPTGLGGASSTVLEAAPPNITHGASELSTAPATSKTPRSRPATASVPNQLPDVLPAVPAQTEPNAKLQRSVINSVEAKRRAYVQQRTIIISIDRNASIRANYSEGETVKAPAPARLSLELLGIFEDLLAKRSITRLLEMEVFGNLLYQTLFADRVGELFDRAYSEVSNYPGERLQLALYLHENPDLERLPWECLFSARGRFFLAASDSLTLSRCVANPLVGRPRYADNMLRRPVRALLLRSDPADLPVLRETEMLEDVFWQLADTHSVEVRTLKKSSTEEFARELTSFCPHLVHFSGHARREETGTSSIAFTALDGRADWSRDRQFDAIFRSSGETPRLLVLRTDGSTLGPQLINAGIANVIEFRYPMSQLAVGTFSKFFYKSVAAGAPVDVSVQRARNHLISFGFRSSESLCFASPVHYAQSKDAAQLILWPPFEARSAETPARLVKPVE